MAERDCSTCAFHTQGAPVDSFCMPCLVTPGLPRWTPEEEEVDSYYEALDERLELGPPEQSRKESLIESFLNVFSGWLISLTLWMFVIGPAFGIHSSLGESALLNGIFTVISVVRGYFWRRFFVNKFWRKNA